MLIKRCITVECTQMPSFIIHNYNCILCTDMIIYLAQRNQYAFKQAFIQHVHFILINSKYRIAEVKCIRLLILWKLCSTTSYVAATFHPTIGQRAHQSLSNAATPELGMILQGIRELAGLHIARIHKNTQPSQPSWVYQAIKELMKAIC